MNNDINQLNEVDKFILLLLKANNEKPVPGALWLQKELFLLQNIFPRLADETDFDSYFLGPYSEVVNDEEEELHKSNLIQINGDKRSLTTKGRNIVEEILKKTDKKEIDKIEQFKGLLNDLTKDELLALIYFTSPITDEIRKESIVYRDLSHKRKNIAVSLYKKGKVSAQRASQIAGIDLEDFLKLIKSVTE